MRILLATNNARYKTLLSQLIFLTFVICKFVKHFGPMQAMTQTLRKQKRPTT